MSKKGISVSVDQYLHEQAKKRGINISDLLDRAIANKLDPSNVANIKDKDPDPKEYPFEVCADVLPDNMNKRLFGMCGIKAKRCIKCQKVFFVNDLAGEFVTCTDCSNATLPDVDRVE